MSETEPTPSLLATVMLTAVGGRPALVAAPAAPTTSSNGFVADAEADALAASILACARRPKKVAMILSSNRERRGAVDDKDEAAVIAAQILSAYRGGR